MSINNCVIGYASTELNVLNVIDGDADDDDDDDDV
jgi:hypothetical protein